MPPEAVAKEFAPSRLYFYTMRIIFLDIDGVLNHWDGIQKHGMDYIGDAQVAQLARVVDATDARFVLTSTWRLEDKNITLVREAMAKHSIDEMLIDFTSNLGYTKRAAEIRKWMFDNRHHIEKFAILDDDDEIIGDQGFNDQFFHTDGTKGLTKEIADKMIDYFLQQ